MKPYNRLCMLLTLVLIVFSTGCSVKLRQRFVTNNNKIYIEQWGSYFPNGYNGLMSDNYPGVLALGDNEFIFDAEGSGSKLWMSPIAPFTIHREEIEEISISEEKSFKKRVLTIKTKNANTRTFLISEGDKFHKSMKDWLSLKT